MKMFKRILKITGLVLLLSLIAAVSIAMYNWRDRNPDYAVDLKIVNRSLYPIRAGFAKRTITPTIVDT